MPLAHIRDPTATSASIIAIFSLLDGSLLAKWLVAVCWRHGWWQFLGGLVLGCIAVRPTCPCAVLRKVLALHAEAIATLSGYF